MENSSFNFNAFIADSKQAFLKPEEYFGSMSTAGGFGPPLIKAVLYGLISGIIYFIWSLLKLGAVSGLLGGAVGFLSLIWFPIAAIIGLFIGAVIILILVSIAGGKTDFEPILHVQAALLVVMPVSALLGFLSGVHHILGSLVSLAVNLYFLWMLFHAMTKTLGAKVDTSKIIMYVLAGILILFFFIGLATRRAAQTFMRDFENFDFSEQLDNRPVSPFGEKTYTGLL